MKVDYEGGIYMYQEWFKDYDKINIEENIEKQSN